MKTVLPLLPIVAGGLLALAGSLAAGLYQHRLKREADGQAIRREKLERFVTLLNLLHHLGLSAGTASELEQSRQWLEYITEMVVITQIHLPELLSAQAVTAHESRDFAMAGQRMFAAVNGDTEPAAELMNALGEDFEARRKRSQVAWEYALDQATALAERMGLRGAFKPLPGEMMLEETEPGKESLAQ